MQGLTEATEQEIQHASEQSSGEVQGELTYLVAEDLKVAASLLFQTYYNDELLQKIFRADKADYDKRLRAAIREDLTSFWESGQPIIGIRDGGTLLGVACLTRPGKSFGPGRFWHWRISMLLTAGFLSTKQVMEKERRIQEAMPNVSYHMLTFIAVAPQYQQQGIGHLLVEAAKSAFQEDPESQGIAVFVTRADYQAFFKKRGYRLQAQIEFETLPGELLFYPKEEAE